MIWLMVFVAVLVLYAIIAVLMFEFFTDLLSWGYAISALACLFWPGSIVVALGFVLRALFATRQKKRDRPMMRIVK